MGDLGQRAPVAPHRRHEDDEVLHRSRQHRTDHQPEKSGKKPELRRQDRPQQRPGSGNRREVMAEEDDFIRGMEIHAVVEPNGGSDTLVIQFDNLFGQPSPIEPIGQHIDAGRCYDEPETIYFFVGINETCHKGERRSAENGEEPPKRQL